MRIDGTTQFMKNCIYIAGIYNFSLTDLERFLFDKDASIYQRNAFSSDFIGLSEGRIKETFFMPSYDEAGRLATLAGVELFEVFSRSLKRLDELGELPQ